MHGVFIWRFQPFHLWHMDAIATMLQKCSLITIVIWSADKQNSSYNPRSVIERYQLLDFLFRDQSHIRITHQDDLPGNDQQRWNNLMDITWPTDIIYSGNDRVLGIAEDNNIKTHKIVYSIDINATMIRHLIEDSYEIDSFLPYPPQRLFPLPPILQ